MHQKYILPHEVYEAIAQSMSFAKDIEDYLLHDKLPKGYRIKNPDMCRGLGHDIFSKDVGKASFAVELRNMVDAALGYPLPKGYTVKNPQFCVDADGAPIGTDLFSAPIGGPPASRYAESAELSTEEVVNLAATSNINTTGRPRLPGFAEPRSTSLSSRIGYMSLGSRPTAPAASLPEAEEPDEFLEMIQARKKREAKKQEKKQPAVEPIDDYPAGDPLVSKFRFNSPVEEHEALAIMNRNIYKHVAVESKYLTLTDDQMIDNIIAYLRTHKFDATRANMWAKYIEYKKNPEHPQLIQLSDFDRLDDAYQDAIA